jgi:hypothetical protein
MRLSKGQFSTLSDICRETAMVILGSLVIGNILAAVPNVVITLSGFLAYFSFASAAIYFRKKGE